MLFRTVGVYFSTHSNLQKSKGPYELDLQWYVALCELSIFNFLHIFGNFKTIITILKFPLFSTMNVLWTTS